MIIIITYDYTEHSILQMLSEKEKSYYPEGRITLLSLGSTVANNLHNKNSTPVSLSHKS